MDWKILDGAGLMLNSEALNEVSKLESNSCAGELTLKQAGREQSITRRLTRMNLLVSGTALLLACAAFSTYDWVTYRANTVRARAGQALMISINSVSALEFNDTLAAQKTLSALRATPSLLFAGIYKNDGTPFVVYRRDGSEKIPPAPTLPAGQDLNYAFHSGKLALERPVELDGKFIGTVYLLSDSRDIDSRLVRYAEIVAIVFLMSLLAALTVSSISQRKISRPIVQLADLAGSVSRNKNYSVRAEPSGSNDEISKLIASFNEMLAQIQQRDTALQQAHDELEGRVRERTAELEGAQLDLRTLSTSLIQMQDDERRRIARELHDSAGQILVALKLNLAQLEPNAEHLDPRTSRLGECLALIDQLTKELRTISHLLHPPLLDELGLISAVRWYVEGFADRSKIPVALELSSDFGRLPRELETTIFRIVQECLTNIHRHSGSSTAAIRITRDSEHIELEVRDFGKGIPGARGSTGPITPGVGIQGMRERVRQLNGTLEIHSNKGGTIVLVRLPISMSSDNHRRGDSGGETTSPKPSGNKAETTTHPTLT